MFTFVYTLQDGRGQHCPKMLYYTYTAGPKCRLQLFGWKDGCGQEGENLADFLTPTL